MVGTSPHIEDGFRFVRTLPVLRRKRFWLGVLISAVFLAFFLVRTDISEIREAFSGADYLLAAAAVPIYFVGYWLRAMRWGLLLRPVANVVTARLYPVVLIGLMSNNVAPMRIGELVRAFLVGQRESISKSAAFGTIAVDRTFDGLTLVAVLGVVTALSDTDAGRQSLGIGAALLFVAGTAVLVGLAFSPLRVRNLLLRVARFLPERLSSKAEEALDAFLSGLAAIRSPGVLVIAAGVSLASWLVEASMYYVVGEAFHLGVGFDVYLIIAAAANLALSIFASPGGVGPFELATREVLVLYNVSSASASAYAIALHALLLVPVIVVGFVLLWSMHMSLRQLLGIPDEPPRVSVAEAGASE
ncbi:MAG TPA: lysylphosphatidylglycerol synthase transmembrane domain-containing protein [Dehalococcoidia bacterium]|nr:lysylphosphatidylglycerol synthase transmembrane domain-containing protein [Dehalococcoidia bacterium]